MANNYLGKLNIARQRTKNVVVDWLTTFIAFFCFNVFRFYYMKLGDDFQELTAYLFSSKLILEQAFVPVVLLFVYWLSGYYNRPFERSRLNEFLTTLYSQIFNAVVIYLAALTNDHLYLRRENWMLLLILFLLLFTFTYIGRLLVTERMIKRIKNIRPRTVIIGLSDEARATARKIADPDIKPNGEIIGFVPFGNENRHDQIDSFSGAKVFNNIEELKEMCRQGKIDQVIIVPTPGKSPTNKILYLLYNLYPYEVSIKIQPDTLALITPTIRLEDIMGEPFIDLSTPQISEFTKNVKRAIDVFASGAAMILLSPLFGILSLGVKLSGPGKIFYRQERVGRQRRPFNIIKFRSMVPEAEKDGIPKLSNDNDTRITKIGKWMRKYRFDELPQMWNVFKGEMSLVGPRPEREFYIEQIVRKAPWYPLIFQVRPGVTSWGMVKYGYATDIDQMIERNRYDLIYLANMSIAVDFKILIHTVKTVSTGQGK